MENNKNQIIRACSLYINDWHLTTMLLPFINRKINSNEKILTILEDSLKSNIEELLSKMNLKPETQNKILGINWDSNETCKYSKIKDQIKTMSKDVQAINIIVNGTEEYKTVANRNIEKLLEEITGKKVTIINCYEISKYNKIDNILEIYDFVLNTSGIKKIEEIFTEYKHDNDSKNKKEII